MTLENAALSGLCRNPSASTTVPPLLDFPVSSDSPELGDAVPPTASPELPDPSTTPKTCKIRRRDNNENQVTAPLQGVSVHLNM